MRDKDCRMERIHHRQGGINAFEFCRVWKDKICGNNQDMTAILQSLSAHNFVKFP